MHWKTKNKLKQNAIAYGFLFIPLLLLGIFTFYPLLYGIYISFMKFEILKRPVVGGPLTFMAHFIQNLQLLSHPILNIVILVGSIFALAALIKMKKVTRKLLPVLLIALFLINILPATNVFEQTLKEVNYVTSEERVLKNAMAERYAKMLEKKYDGTNAQIIKEPVNNEETRLTVKESTWIGFEHYKRIFKNREFAEFVQQTTWYQLLLILTVLEFVGLFFVSRFLKNDKLQILYKLLMAVTLTALVLITWPKMFHARIWLFYEGLENSLKYLLVVIPIQFFSILLAVLVNQKVKGIKLFRTLYYIPVITGIIIIGYCWKWVFYPDGLLNATLQMLGILQAGQKIYWLSDSRIALWVVMFVTIWRGLGYYMVIYMAGLQNIPNDLVEAATIDGASKGQLVTRIYLPLLRPTIFLCTTLSTMAALKIFEELFVLTSGTAKTTTLVYLIYDKAFGGTEFKFGYSSALAVVLSLIIGFFTILNFKANKQGDQNE